MSYQVNGVYVHTNKEFREALHWQRVESLAMAYRWVRDRSSIEEAEKMVLSSLKCLAEDPSTLDNVIAEAISWDESEASSKRHDREM